MAAMLTMLAASLMGRRMKGAFRTVVIGSFTVVLLQGIFWTAILTA